MNPQQVDPAAGNQRHPGWIQRIQKQVAEYAQEHRKGNIVGLGRREVQDHRQDQVRQEPVEEVPVTSYRSDDCAHRFYFLSKGTALMVNVREQ